MSKKTIEDLGEFGLIDEIKKWVLPLTPTLSPRGRGKGEGIIGIGDDTAVFRSQSGMNQLLTIDALVEGVDFLRKKAAPQDIGWKALAINLSDIAAMGGIPKVAVISLSLPPRTTVDFVKGFYEGIRKLAQKFGVSIVGGDLSRGKVFSSSIALLGESHPKFTIYRTRAKIGDFVCVTGRLGGSILGKHLNFTPRIKEGQFLAEQGVSAMIDISDGLEQDLKHITDESHVGGMIDERKIPISKEALKLARGDRRAALQHALSDGEDFELLFTISEDRLYSLEKAWRKKFKLPLTQIGKIVARNNAALKVRKRLGFQHF